MRLQKTHAYTQHVSIQRILAPPQPQRNFLKFPNVTPEMTQIEDEEYRSR